MSPEQSMDATVKKLAEQADRLRNTSGLEILSSRKPETNFNLEIDGIHVDWSFQRIDQVVYELLLELAEKYRLIPRIRDQFNGQIVNPTENRPVLHTALRGSIAELDTQTINELERDIQSAMVFARRVLNGEIRGYWNDQFTTVLHIGIGGSCLGQKLLYQVLGTAIVPVHFLTNVDDTHVATVLSRLDPKSTLILVASKSMTTEEVLRNYKAVKSWFNERTNSLMAFEHHCVCISANTNVAAQMGQHRFRIPESIGGRYSIWSAMGLSIMISHGVEVFREFLQGAREIDQITLTNPIEKNASLILALLAYWNINFLDIESHVVGSYIHQLELLVPYLQQLELESNGKSIRTSGDAVNERTTVAIWGGLETDGQHAWHQFLHQGTSRFSADLIAESCDNADSNASWQLANCLAQRRLLFKGMQVPNQPSYKDVIGNHSCNLILLDKTDARTLGKVIALYEHKVAFLGLLWNVNSFDQFGVEHGKELTDLYHRALTSGVASGLTSSEQDLINTIRLKFKR